MQNYIFKMNIIPETELILTEKNRIYHLNLIREEIARDIILVGDPSRVKMISNKFDIIEHKISHREFITHTGMLNNKKISVISTGIGTDNIDIVINELDAIFNINFKTRKIKKNKITLNIIRLGTSGAIQQNIPVNSFIVSTYALGFDGLAHYYESNKVLKKDILNKFNKHFKSSEKLAEPYFIKASDDLLNIFLDLKQGITATTSGFYAPQDRKLRLNPSINDLSKRLNKFSYNNIRITNFEMETSALYYLGQTLGHNTLTICAVLGNRNTNNYSKNTNETINNMIDIVLKRLCK